MNKFIAFSSLLAVVFLSSCATDPNNRLFNFGNTASPHHWVDAEGNAQMDAPPPGEGIQMRILPFVVPQDSEVQGNFYFEFPSDVDFQIGRIEIAMNEGTH